MKFVNQFVLFYKNLIVYREGAYERGYLLANHRNIVVLDIIIAIGVFAAFSVGSVIGQTLMFRIDGIVALCLSMVVSAGVGLFALNSNRSNAALCMMRNIAIMIMLLGISQFMYYELKSNGSLYVYTVAAILICSASNLSGKANGVILLLINANAYLCMHASSASYHFALMNETIVNPHYSYMFFCTVIAWVSGIRRHIDYLMIVRQRVRLKIASETDPLTKLFNRRGMESFIRRAKYRGNVGAALFDIDDFKSYNDTYGHKAGDECLATVASLMREAAEESEKQPVIAVRYGGEEMLLLFFHDDKKKAMKSIGHAIERLRKLKLKSGADAVHPCVSLSCGFAMSEKPLGADTELYYGLVAEADSHLYAAKNLGKNQCMS